MPPLTAFHPGKKGQSPIWRVKCPDIKSLLRHNNWGVPVWIEDRSGLLLKFKLLVSTGSTCCNIIPTYEVHKWIFPYGHPWNFWLGACTQKTKGFSAEVVTYPGMNPGWCGLFWNIKSRTWYVSHQSAFLYDRMDHFNVSILNVTFVISRWLF